MVLLAYRAQFPCALRGTSARLARANDKAAISSNHLCCRSCRVELVANAAAQPLCQAGVITFCILWWASGLPTDVLTATLSILAITLTQMVLNRQKLREKDDRRRDVAMHAKLDEL